MINAQALSATVVQKNSMKINGWNVKYQPDFVKFYSSQKYLDRLNVGGSSKAKKIIDNKIRAICNSADPNSSRYPKLGNMKWLKGKKGVKIQEDRLTGDYRILFLPTDQDKQELTFFTIRDHDGVQEFLRDAHARVHNAAMDEFQILDWEESEEYTVEMGLPNAEEMVEQIQNRLKEIVGEREINENTETFLRVTKKCSIYRLGKYGIELDPSPEQLQHIASPSPMLLPGVAGTGKSTVLQYRYRDALLSYAEDYESFSKNGIYLTLNKPLALTTKREIKKLLPEELEHVVVSGIQDINSWVSALLGEEPAISTPNVNFELFRKWWSKRQQLQQYDPAQAWEEYRGVIKGTGLSVDVEGGAISLEQYLGLPHDRCAYQPSERTAFYSDIVVNFQHFRRNSDSVLYDDQDLIRKVIKLKLPLRYRHIFVDEVQDLTELQLSAIINMLDKDQSCICSKSGRQCQCPPSCENCRCLIFDVTGDLSQQVYPTRFRWEDTSRTIFEELDLRCHEPTPMATSYRSVRSIVDLSSFYHQKMISDYRQGGNITQAQAEQKAETPAYVFEDDETLHQIIVDAELPAAHCPIIVRNESSKNELLEKLFLKTEIELRNKLIRKFHDAESVVKTEFDNQFPSEVSRIRSYTLTVAEAKGLEWNNVVLWDISSGSDHLLEKKFHELRGNYIGSDDWNYQLELRHAFVATTRARLLLLHLVRRNNQQPTNPFLQELSNQSLIVVEKKPVNLSRFSKTELSIEEYEVMAEDYENKEMFGAAALIYKNNLNNPMKAKQMEFYASKQVGDTMSMARHLIDYVRTYQNELIPDQEKWFVLNLLDDNGSDTELGYIIEISDMLGQTERAKLASIKRNIKLCAVFGTVEAFSSIAHDFEEIGMLDDAGDYHFKAGKIRLAIKCWWDARKYEKAWLQLLKLMAPGEKSEIEVLLIEIVTTESISRENKTLLSEEFNVRLSHASHKAIKKLDVDLNTLQFRFDDAIKRVNDLRFLRLSNEERAQRYIKNGHWREGLDIALTDNGLDLPRLFDLCDDIDLELIVEWFADLEHDGISRNRKFKLMQVIFNKKCSKNPRMAEVEKFLVNLYRLKQVNKQAIGAVHNLERWYHAIHCTKYPQDVNTGPGKANISRLVQWYVHEEVQANTLLLHTIRLALFKSLEKSYNTLDSRKNRILATKVDVKASLLVAELYLKTQMNPRRFKIKKYSQIRKDVISWIIHEGKNDFIDAWFDFLLDMKPDAKIIENHSRLKQDIQAIIPMYASYVALGQIEDVINVHIQPDDSITRRYREDRPHSFSRDGIEVLERDKFSRGMKNSITRIIKNAVDQNNGNIDSEMWVKELLLDGAKEVEPASFFDTVETFLAQNTESLGAETSFTIKKAKTVNARKQENTPVPDQYKNSEPTFTVEESLPAPSKENISSSDKDAPGQYKPKKTQEDESKTNNLTHELAVDNSESIVEKLNASTIIQHLSKSAPGNVAEWFTSHYAKKFNKENTTLIMETYTTLKGRLERQQDSITISIVNEWLCFHEILKIMREDFNFSTNPYTNNQTMAAQLQTARREVAVARDLFDKEKISALISIR